MVYKKQWSYYLGIHQNLCSNLNLDPWFQHWTLGPFHLLAPHFLITFLYSVSFIKSLAPLRVRFCPIHFTSLLAPWHLVDFIDVTSISWAMCPTMLHIWMRNLKWWIFALREFRVVERIRVPILKNKTLSGYIVNLLNLHFYNRFSYDKIIFMLQSLRNYF